MAEPVTASHAVPSPRRARSSTEPLFVSEDSPDRVERRKSFDLSSLSGEPPKSPSSKNRLKVQVCVRLRPEIAELDAPPPFEPTPPPSPAERSGIGADWRVEADRMAAAEKNERAVNERPWLVITGGGSENAKNGKAAKDGDHLAFRGARFRFKHVFPPACSNLQVYEAAHEKQVRGVLRGYDNTIMCYGQTGSGKTHTMFGTDEDPGLVPLAVAALFSQMSELAVRRIAACTTTAAASAPPPPPAPPPPHTPPFLTVAQFPSSLRLAGA